MRLKKPQNGSLEGKIWRAGIILYCLPLFIGCDLINPADPVPAVLSVSGFEVETTVAEGSGQHLITDAWLYVDGALLGAYPLPADIPVIANGGVEIILFPGIRVNGIRATPDIYPFLEAFSTSLNLEPEIPASIAPVLGYKDNLEFVFNEDFELGTVFRDDLDGDPQTRVEVTSSEVFEGTSSGLIRLSANQPVIEVATVDIYQDLPTNNAPVYLELHYRNNTEFTIGLIGRDASFAAKSPVITLRTRDTWNKIYIDLTEALNLSQFPGYQILIQAVHDMDNTEGSQIYLDNIKLIHFSA